MSAVLTPATTEQCTGETRLTSGLTITRGVLKDYMISIIAQKNKNYTTASSAAPTLEHTIIME